MLRKRAELAEIVWCWGESPLRHELVSRRASGLMGHDGVGLVVRVPEGAEAGLTPFGLSREHATILGVGTYALFEDEQAFIDVGPLTLVIRPVTDPLEGAPRQRIDLWRHRWLATSLCMHAMVIAPEGRVSSAVIEDSELGDADTERCLEQAVRRWSYPRSDGVTAVRYPFVFQDGEDSP